MKTSTMVHTALGVILFGVCGCRRADVACPQSTVNVDAGGHRLHMLIVGGTGPTVVLESGLGAGLGWEQVRAEVGRFARVVTYDRAGIGKSEPGPRPRTARQIARELHAALENAGLPPPYLLVGHSMGGPYVRVFAALFPQEVSGMVLVDPTQINECETMGEIKSWFEAHCAHEWDAVEAACNQLPEALRGLKWMTAREAKRIEEFLANVPRPGRETMRREWRAHLASRSRQPSASRLSSGARDEFEAATESFRQAIAAPPPPHVPVIVLSADGSTSLLQSVRALNPNVRDLERHLRSWHLEDYQRWVAKTPQARLVVARRCGHIIQRDDPGLVVTAIREVLQQSADPTR